MTTLREDLRAINRTARSLAVDELGIGDLFKMSPGSSEQNLLAAAARAFLRDAAPLEEKFIAFELLADFLAGLQADIEIFEKTVTEKSAATGEKISATASIADAVSKGLTGLCRLRAIVFNKYRDRPTKLAVWTTSSHIVGAIRRKTPVPPPPK